MKNKQLFLSMLMVGMSLGTAWAIRGKFGHEQGAAWAGAIGALSVLLVAKRADWFANAFNITLAGALGWGIGGIMSYGLVVGYGKASDFVNVYYGLLMLFVIGGLYGFIGGGLFGISLTNTTKNPIKWHSLIIEMAVGGLIFYYFLIEQFGWLMTPPRSEVWAVCLGMAAALIWNLVRNKHYSALRVAVFSGLGGGFGFAFGDFLQVLGKVSEIHFNFWNVMEYSLGFFGGLGMAYGTLTSKWEVSENLQSKNSQLFPLLMLVLVIPFIVWQQTFEIKRITEIISKLNVSEGSPIFEVVQWFSLFLMILMCIVWLLKFFIKQSNVVSYSFSEIFTFFIGHLGLYIVFSLLITGAFLSTYLIEQYLYILNLLVVIFVIRITKPEFYDYSISLKKWSLNMTGVIIVIAILAFILINSHDNLKGAQKRFNNDAVKTELNNSIL